MSECTLTASELVNGTRQSIVRLRMGETSWRQVELSFSHAKKNHAICHVITVLCIEPRGLFPSYRVYH
jgi:hypothetical protein